MLILPVQEIGESHFESHFAWIRNQLPRVAGVARIWSSAGKSLCRVLESEMRAHSIVSVRASLVAWRLRVCLQCGRPGSFSGSRRSPGKGHGSPLQFSCLENPMDGGAWRAAYSPYNCRKSDMTELLHTTSWNFGSKIAWVCDGLRQFSWFSLTVWPVREKEQTLQQLLWNFEWLVHVYVLSHLSRVRLFVTLWTAAHQAPLSVGFPRQEYWSGLPYPPSGDLPDPGIKPHISYVSCIGRLLLYRGCHLGSPEWQAANSGVYRTKHAIFAVYYHDECQDSNCMIYL